MKKDPDNTLIIKKGFKSWETPKGRECFVDYNDEGNLLVITFWVNISEDLIEIDIMAGEKRRWCADGTVLPYFFVLENTRMIIDKETGEIDPLSVYCSDEQEARRILKNQELFRAVLSLFQNHNAMSVAITDDSFAVSWINFQPSPEKDSYLLSSLFNLFDRIEDELNPQGISSKKSEHSDESITDLEQGRTDIPLTEFLRDLKPDKLEAYHILAFLIILACSSFFATMLLHSWSVMAWIFKRFFIPSIIIFFLYYYLIHVRYFSIWNSTRLGKEEKNPGEPFRFITGIVGSLFFGPVLVVMMSFPVAVKNRYTGHQTLVTNSAVIIEKDPGGGVDHYSPSLKVKNSQGRFWAINVNKDEFKSYKEGDSYSVKLYRGSLGLHYYR